MSWNAVIQMLIALGAIIVVDCVLRFVVSRIKKKFEKKDLGWNLAVMQALSMPLRVFIWVVGLFFVADLMSKEVEVALFSAMMPLRNVGIMIALGWFLLRLVKFGEMALETHFHKRKKTVDATTKDAVGKVLRVAIIVASALVILQALGFSVSGVIAFAGISSFAIGFAAKDLLANFFGAFMIYWDRPFVVGDWIRSPDREIEGFVEEIGWRLTKIRTFDRRPLYVPNATFSTISVQNPSRMSNRQIRETIGIRYDDILKVEVIVADMRQFLREHPEIDQKRLTIVNFTTFGPSTLDIFIYTFTKTIVWSEFHAIKQEIMIGFSKIIAAHGAEIAFPTSTLHIATSEHPEQMVSAAHRVPSQVNIDTSK